MSDTNDTLSPSDRQNLEMQVTMNMEVDGTELSADRRAEIVAQLGYDPDAPTEAPTEPETKEPQSELQALIAAEVAKAVGGGMAPLTQAAPALEDVLLAIDPKDSDSALLLFEWLQATGRLSVVATLQGNGGYLFHYQEPKGSTKAGYIPGGTQGGRMVDAALETAKASGAKPKDQGMCGKCFTVVERKDDGTVVSATDGVDVCPQGGQHTFNA